jgi:hypothetical protein
MTGNEGAVNVGLILLKLGQLMPALFEKRVRVCAVYFRRSSVLADMFAKSARKS